MAQCDKLRRVQGNHTIKIKIYSVHKTVVRITQTHVNYYKNKHHVYELNRVPSNSYVETLTPSMLE